MNRYVDILMICLLVLVGWFLKKTYDVKDERERVTWLRISPSGRLLVRAGDEPLTVFDLASGDVVASFDRAFRAEFSPDEKLLAAANPGGTVSLFGLATGKQVAELDAEQQTIQWLRFSPDSSKLATSGRHSKWKDIVKVWDTRTGSLLFEFPAISYRQNLSFSPDGTLLVTVGSDRSTETTTISLWDAMSGEELYTFIYDEYADARNLSFSRDGRRILLDTGIWDIDSGERVARFFGTNGGLQRFGGDDETLLSMTRDPYNNVISLTEIDSGAVLWTIRSRLGLYGDVRYETATGYLTLVGHDGTMEVLDTSTRKRIKSLSGLTVRRLRPHWYIIGALATVWSMAWIRIRGKFSERGGDAVERKLDTSWWYVTAVAVLVIAQGSVLAWNFAHFVPPIASLPGGFFSLQFWIGIAVLIVAFTMRVSMTSVVACVLMLAGTIWLTIQLIIDRVSFWG